MKPASQFEDPGEPPARDTFSARDAMLDWMQQIAPYGIFTTDAELRIRSWNHWLGMHSGLSAEKVIGRPLVEVFPEVKARRLDEPFHRALRGEVSLLSTALHKYLLPFPTPARDSGIRHMLQTVRIAPLPAGDLILGTITIIEDVTQRERHALLLQRQQDHDRILSAALALLLESRDPLADVPALFPKLTLPLGLEAYLHYLHEPASGTLRLNSAGGISPRQKETLAAAPLGDGLCGGCAQNRQATIVTHLQDRTDPASHPLRGMGIRACCAFPLLIEDRLLGTLAFASYSRDTIAADEVECLRTIAQYVAIAMDRAQREQALREAQRSLSEHADQLETKVSERTARLHETIAQLESFTYTVAHDLRAPIRALKGYCDILRSDYPLPESGQAILERLQRASTRLDYLTRDLLKFSKIGRASVQLEPIDVAEVVHDLIVMTPALQGGVVTVGPALGTVLAQRTLLQQCLSNLFDNAIKFATPGLPPHIVVRTERIDRDAASAPGVPGAAFNPVVGRSDATTPASSAAPRLRVWIEDNGIGIPAEAHDKIFGIFERATGHDHIEGTGIGLAIVARAMQQMQGTCGVESKPAQGSRFWLELAAA